MNHGISLKTNLPDKSRGSDRLAQIHAVACDAEVEFPQGPRAQLFPGAGRSALAWSPCGRVLAAGCDSAVALVTVDDGCLVPGESSAAPVASIVHPSAPRALLLLPPRSLYTGHRKDYFQDRASTGFCSSRTPAESAEVSVRFLGRCRVDALAWSPPGELGRPGTRDAGVLPVK